MKWLFYCIVFALLLPYRLISQNEIEKYFESADDGYYSNSQIEAIEYYRNNPFNLYEVSPENLLRLKVLSLSEAKLIYKLVNRVHRFHYSMITDSLGLSPEIRHIFEVCTYYKIKRKSQSTQKIAILSRYKRNFETKRGFAENKYIGNPLDMNNRIIANHSGFETGLLTSKQAGERELDDMLTAYLRYERKDFHIIIGDYNLDFAGGSLFSGAFGKRKGSSTIGNIIFLGDGISPNRSSMESGLFRGVAASGNIYTLAGKVNIAGFHSDKMRGATVNDNNTVTSVYSAGYYRTANEISKKNKLNEKVSGLNLLISKKNLMYGITGYYLEYDKDVISSAQSVYSGKTGLFSSAYLYYSIDNNFINLETSLDGNKNQSYFINYEYLCEKQKFALNFRHLSEDFRSPYGNSMTENSYLSNETGFYAGYEIKINKILIKLYSDIYNTLSPTYFVPMPVKGIDLFSETLVKIANDKELLIRLKSENKSESFKNEVLNSNQVLQLTKTYLRIDYSRKFDKSLFMRYRIELTRNKSGHNNERGFLTFFELKHKGSMVDYDARVTYFDTDSYDSAIWLFEYAVPGYITTVPLYGQGARITFGARLKINENIDIRLRYANILKNNTSKIGSGYEEINGNFRSDLILQLNTKL